MQRVRKRPRLASSDLEMWKVDRKAVKPKTRAQRPAPKQHAVERHAHLLDIATREFLAKGFRETSIDGIAAEAGVSKATIYKRYRNKSELFEAVIYAVTDNITLEPTAWDSADIERSLRAWAQAFYRVNTTARCIEVSRMMIAEAPHQPELVGKLRQLQIDRTLKALIDFFALLKREKKIVDMDPAELAVGFSMIVIGGWRTLLATPETAAAATRRINTSVSMLLHGILR